METGDHLVFEYEGTRGFTGWDWRRWVDLDDKSRWAYDYEHDGRVMLSDRVKDFFARFDCELGGVG